MELERELRDMDMTLELGNSIASLGARTQNRLKYSTTLEDGSFMVVPPSSSGSSYMSSSLWASGIARPSGGGAAGGGGNGGGNGGGGGGGGGGRARPNLVRTIMMDASSTVPQVIAPPPPQRSSTTQHQPGGLESSWWGNGSTASQILAGSVVSLSGTRPLMTTTTTTMTNHGEATNTKQLMRLLDSIRTLSDENAALLREVEGAETARMEAKRAKEQMRHFKAEYGKRCSKLKSALEKFRQSHPGMGSNNSNVEEPNPIVGR